MSALRTVLGASIAIVLVGSLGCSGSGATTSGDGGTSSSGGSSGSGSGSGGNGSSSGTSSGGGDDASGGGGDDATTLPGGDDASPPPGDDDASIDIDASHPGGGMTTPPRGTDGGAGQIACGGKACDSATQVCCNTGRAETCETAMNCKGTTLACTGTNSCTSGICCYTRATGMTAATSACMPTCGTGEFQLCTTDTDCPSDEICSRATASCVKPPTPRDAGAGFPRPDGGMVGPVAGKDGGIGFGGH
ncbi:MAG TPA: hypothetical protein VHV30_07995 [Polyangiaceae bacterium]|nr:hypothetical protein [Polyangiaceae bacterium]